MYKSKRIFCILLSLCFVFQLLAGCSKIESDDTIYLTKGEFFAYFVYDNGLTSEKYTVEDIEKCEDGSVEAEIIVEWGYLTEDQALKNLKNAVEKETVVMVCANSTFELCKGNIEDIKDADLLENPQLIADAYASGFCELENGYFDGAKKLTFAECEEIMNKAKAYIADFHYEANTEITETAEGVHKQDESDYEDGDVVVEFFYDDTESESESANATIDAEDLTNTLLNNNDPPIVTTLGNSKENLEVTNVNNELLLNKYQRKVNGFAATIDKMTFENALGNPNVGDTVVMNAFQLKMTNTLLNYSGQIIGVLVDKKQTQSNYVCMFEYPEFETAIQKENVKQANTSGIDKSSFKIEVDEVDGWKLNFEVTSGSIKVNTEKNFTVYETGRKQDWQNSKKTMTATASFEISDFNIDVKNLKSFANKKGTGFVKITCDSTIGCSLSRSLRYTPDSNRNGKFPSNWSNSRWTDSDSAGAKTIKIARFKPSFYGVVGADIYIYMLISVDGKISFTTSMDNGGILITANNGKISSMKLGEKKQVFDAQVNVHTRTGVQASFQIFSFINVIKYDIGFDADAHALVNLYYKEKLSKGGVCADPEGLGEYAADDSEFKYCIGALIELGVSGKMMDSGVKMILDYVSKGTSLDFTIPLWSGGFHIEETGKVDKCTRGNDLAEELEKSKDDTVELKKYKVVLEEGNMESVSLSAIPSETMDLLDTKNSITVSSLNEKVCKVKYNKKAKTIIIDAIGEGSTEIVVKAKKGALWWKKTCEQKVSVTVSKNNVTETSAVNGGQVVYLNYSLSSMLMEV